MTTRAPHPLVPFRFRVSFKEASLAGARGTPAELCNGAFSQVSGLEATMEPKAVKEGGHNYGAAQRVGRSSFATVVLKRGITPTRHLWQWFHATANGGYTHRLEVEIVMLDAAGNPAIGWRLDRALPVKMKVPDLDGSAKDVGIEELHLAHEGLTEFAPGGGAGGGR